MGGKTKSGTLGKATPPWATNLTDRERRFVEEYIVDLHAGAAAARAGIGKNQKSSNQLASQLRRKQHVAEAISTLIAERSGATQSRVLEELGKLCFASIGDFLDVTDGKLAVKDLAALTPDQKACIASIEEHISESGISTIRLKLHDKVASIGLLMRSLGMHINRTEISGPGGGPVQVESHEVISLRINQRLDAIAARNQAQLPMLPAPVQVPMPVVEGEFVPVESNE